MAADNPGVDMISGGKGIGGSTIARLISLQHSSGGPGMGGGAGGVMEIGNGSGGGSGNTLGRQDIRLQWLREREWILPQQRQLLVLVRSPRRQPR